MSSAIAAWTDRALGETAQRLQQSVHSLALPRSPSLGEVERDAFWDALNAAYLHSQVSEWIEAGNLPAQPSTYGYAKQFVASLPSSVKMPDVAVDLDGEILLEWDHGPRRVMSISVSRDGTLAYAALLGFTRLHGTTHFRETLPLAVNEALEKVGALSAVYYAR